MKDEISHSRKNIFIVDSNGEGDYKIIQEAIDAADPGDIIRVYAGIYYENIVINKTISLIGTGSGSTVIQGNQTVISVKANKCEIEGFTLKTSENMTGYGLRLNSNYNTIEDLKVNNFCTGLYVDHSNHNVLNKITANNNAGKGITIHYSDNNSVNNSICNFNNEFSLYVGCSNNNTVSNSVINGNLWGILVAGRKEQGWDSQWNEYFGPTIPCSNNRFNGCTVNDNEEYGIKLFDADGNNFRDCLVQNNGDNGIDIRYAINTTLRNCVSNSNEENGFLFSNTENTLVENCSAKNNKNGFGVVSTIKDTHLYCQASSNVRVGIYVGPSSHFMIANSTYDGNQDFGIKIRSDTWDSVFKGNIISNNTNLGFTIGENCRNNSIILNHFINNNNGSRQALDNGTFNRWNTSSNGNYWSDWTEPDNNYDGIVDFPYNIDGNASSLDNFPLTLIDYKDSDNDGYADQMEVDLKADPNDPLSTPPDLDFDGFPDDLDIDIDGDGVNNTDDFFPEDSDRWEEEEEDNSSIWFFVVLIALIISAVLLIIVIIIRKKAIRNTTEDNEENAVDR